MFEVMTQIIVHSFTGWIVNIFSVSTWGYITIAGVVLVITAAYDSAHYTGKLILQLNIMLNVLSHLVLAKISTSRQSQNFCPSSFSYSAKLQTLIRTSFDSLWMKKGQFTLQQSLNRLFLRK